MNTKDIHPRVIIVTNKSTCAGNHQLEYYPYDKYKSPHILTGGGGVKPKVPRSA